MWGGPVGQTYFLHLPCLSQRDSGTLTTQEAKATHSAWLLPSICMPMMRLSSTPSMLHLEGEGERGRGRERCHIQAFSEANCWGKKGGREGRKEGKIVAPKIDGGVYSKGMKPGGGMERWPRDKR